MAAFDEFRKKAVTVFVNSGVNAQKNLLSPLVYTALTGPKMGNTIPKTAATSPQMDSIWGQLSYKQMTEKGIKQLRKDLKAMTDGKAPIAPQTIKFFKWTSRDQPGNAWTGSFRQLNGETLVLKSPEGKIMKLPLSKLSDAASDFARKLGGQSTEKAESLTFQEEEWTSSTGKTIKATFVSLKGSQITLDLANGKQSSFPLTRLAQESQDRAHKLAGK